MSVGKLPTNIIFYAYSFTTCKHAAIATLKKGKVMIRKMVLLSTKNYISILPFTIQLKVLTNNVLYLDENIPGSFLARHLVATLSSESFLKIIRYVSLTIDTLPRFLMS